jgi:tRNA1(Val) A37 N6-methylase TrmN6
VTELTEDKLMGGRVVLRQPAGGFRAAIDPVLLAASVPATARDHVLELGSGTGAAALCLARRVKGARVTGLELQRDLVRIAGENAALNALEAEVAIVFGDILNPPPRLAPGGFDHVMANPPYLEAGTATLPEDDARRAAVGEGAADLKAWLRLALLMVRPKGTVTFIHRADRIDGLLTELHGRAGEIVVFPLWPGVGKPAKRVLVRARRDIQTPARIAPGLVLHAADGKFTAEADAVLRDGWGLVL